MEPAQSCPIDEPRPEGGVHRDQGIDRSKAVTEIAKRVRQRRCRKTADPGHVRRLEVPAANLETRARPHARLQRNHDLDWVHGVRVKAMQPGSGEASEEGAGWQAAGPGGQDMPGILS